MTRIVLQLPDNLLKETGELITAHLKPAHPEQSFFIASDNCRNPCCVDFTAAAHVQADLIVKVGYSCRCEEIEKSSKVRVEYVQEAKTVDQSTLAESVEVCVEKATKAKIDTVLVYVDSVYLDQLETIKSCLKSHERSIKSRYLYIQQKENETKIWSQRRPWLTISGFRRL